MAVNVNLCPNGWMAAPGGYPVRLWAGGDTLISGFLPSTVISISAVVKSEQATSDIHLAIYDAPNSIDSGVLGADSSLVAQTSALGVSVTEETLTLAIPANTSTIPASYVMRLWAENIIGKLADTHDHDADSSLADEIMLPTGVSVSSIIVT